MIGIFVFPTVSRIKFWVPKKEKLENVPFLFVLVTEEEWKKSSFFSSIHVTYEESLVFRTGLSWVLSNGCFVLIYPY